MFNPDGFGVGEAEIFLDMIATGVRVERLLVHYETARTIRVAMEAMVHSAGPY